MIDAQKEQTLSQYLTKSANMHEFGGFLIWGYPQIIPVMRPLLSIGTHGDLLIPPF